MCKLTKKRAQIVIDNMTMKQVLERERRSMRKKFWDWITGGDLAVQHLKALENVVEAQKEEIELLERIVENQDIRLVSAVDDVHELNMEISRLLNLAEVDAQRERMHTAVLINRVEEYIV